MTHLFEWIVVGSGPAGIAALGNLLDAGVKPTGILWVDPKFNVGDFGTSWRYVKSNTSVEHFKKFYHNSQSFGCFGAEYPGFMIDKLAPESNCPLMIAAQPLQWITKNLCNSLCFLQDEVLSLNHTDHKWQLLLRSGKVLHSKKVVLAIGSQAKTLNFSGTPSIRLATALNPIELSGELKSNDSVFVFGSAQSAKSVVNNLSSLKLKRKVLFYRKVETLERHFDVKDLASVEVMPMTSKNLMIEMPSCTKAIYAVGFGRRHIPIAGLPENYGYDSKTGEIAPGIFGLGIAFPEIMPYENGQQEYPLSAIWPYMKRLKKILPYWLSSDTL